MWKGKRLPTEPSGNWQPSVIFASVTTTRGVRFYQEDALNHGQMAAPIADDSDGYLGTSPVGAFPSGNSYNLSDMFGNVRFTSDFRRSLLGLLQHHRSWT